MHNLYKRFGGPVEALAGFSLRVEAGRVCGLLGPNGAGKTTAIRAVAGPVVLDAGTITYQQRPISQTEHCRVGIMPQGLGVDEDMRVGEQLVFIARIAGATKPEAKEAAARWLAELKLSDKAKVRISKLSGGNKRKVQLAAALIHGPEVVLLDEPFVGFDLEGARWLKRLLRDTARRGAVVLVSSHQTDRIAEVCDDLAIMRAGRVVLYGPIQHLLAAHPRRWVDTDTEEEADDLARRYGGEVGDRDGPTYVVSFSTDLAPELLPPGRDLRVPKLEELYHSTACHEPE